MVGINGKIVAEPNDPNTITVESSNLTNGAMLGIVNDKIIRAWTPIHRIIIRDNTWITSLALSANKYLCTDANGDLIFKEL